MKLTFETMTITLPEKDTEAAWKRLCEYMDVYFANHRKNKHMDMYTVEEVDTQQ